MSHCKYKSPGGEGLSLVQMMPRDVRFTVGYFSHTCFYTVLQLYSSVLIARRQNGQVHCIWPKHFVRPHHMLPPDDPDTQVAIIYVLLYVYRIYLCLQKQCRTQDAELLHTELQNLPLPPYNLIVHCSRSSTVQNVYGSFHAKLTRL